MSFTPVPDRSGASTMTVTIATVRRRHRPCCGEGHERCAIATPVAAERRHVPPVRAPSASIRRYQSDTDDASDETAGVVPHGELEHRHRLHVRAAVAGRSYRRDNRRHRHVVGEHVWTIPITDQSGNPHDEGISGLEQHIDDRR